MNLQTTIRLYECLWDTLEILELESVDITQILYCGKSSKWGIPNTLLIVVPDEQVKNNRFYQDMISTSGAHGYGVLFRKVNGTAWDPQNRQYQFSYQVITEYVLKNAALDKIVDDRWQYRTLSEIIDITQQIFRVHNLRAFL